MFLAAIVTVSCKPIWPNESSQDTALRRLENRKAKDHFSGMTIDLAIAIEDEDEARIDSLIRQNANLNEVGKQYLTPLMWALMKRKPVAFARLLYHKPDTGYISPPIPPSGNNLSVMWAAAICEDSYYLQKLLELGANPNVQGRNETSSLLVDAIMNDRLKNVELLIQYGVYLNRKGLGGQTPVNLAAVLDRFEIIESLLQAGADPTIRNDVGRDLYETLDFMHNLGPPQLEPVIREKRAALIAKIKAKKDARQ